MPSRFWLFLTFLAAFGANPAYSAAPDQATGEKLPTGVSTDVALLTSDPVLFEQQLRVLPAKTVVALQNGASHVSCFPSPDCRLKVGPGADPKSFHDAGNEFSSRNGYAIGGSGGGS